MPVDAAAVLVCLAVLLGAVAQSVSGIGFVLGLNVVVVSTLGLPQ